MSRSFPVLVSALLVGACNLAERECEDAIDEREACAADAGVTFSVDNSAFCDDTTRSADYWECYGDVFRAADCSTVAGYDAALALAEACTN